MKLTVALLQILPGSNPSENFERAEKFITDAKQNGMADIVLLPELWTVGYASPDEYGLGKEEWEKSALLLTDDGFLKYQNLAKNLSIAILFPFLEKDTLGNFYNTAVLIDDNGRVVLHYRKVHTVDKGWERMFVRGEDFPVVELSTPKGSVKVGCMICYDREFPESAQFLMLGGAELILVPNACNLERNRIAQFQSRAFENMLGVAMASYPSPKFNGMSCAFDGMRVKGEDYDPLLVMAGKEEGISYAEFDIDKLREYREQEIWGDAYRRPHLYDTLRGKLGNQPRAPFIRGDARR